MNPDIPALPNEASDLPRPEDADAEVTEQTVELAPAAPPLSVDSVAGDVDASSAVASAAAAPPKPAAAAAPDEQSAAMPAMPAMPAEGDDEDDDEDFEIPDEEDLFQAPSVQEGDGGDAEPSGVVQGTVVTVRHDGAFLDVGEKAEAFLPFATARGAKKPDWKLGDVVDVAVSGRSPEGFLLLQSTEATRPAEFGQLEVAYSAGSIVVGKVLEIVKGGLAVDVGARAFLPASRSGERDQEALEALVGQDIRCKIAQLEVEDRNVVLDRRSVIEHDRDLLRREVIEGLREGDVRQGVVRNIRDFGAFVDLGGVDALLHISDISWARVQEVGSALSIGDEIEVKVLRIDESGRRIAVGLKQLQPDPWTQIADTLTTGDRIKGTVTRLKDFGAFVEIVPGAEGLIHVSEMSWGKRVRHPSDVLNVGDQVEAVVLDLNLAQRRVAMGLKQALGDPWERFEDEHPVGSALDGTVQKTTNFGAFVEVADGVEGLLHVSDITSERRLNHPNEMIKTGQQVRVKILEIDRAKRRLKLGMKQLEPTDQDRYVEAVKPGDAVSGRILEVRGETAHVQLDEGVRGVCRIEADAPPEAEASADDSGDGADVSSLSARLEAAWKGGEHAPGDSADGPRQGEVLSFRVLSVDEKSGEIELKLEG